MKNKSILIAHYRPDIVSGAERAIVDLIAPLKNEFDFTMLVPGAGTLADFYQEAGLNVWVESISTPRRMFPGLHAIQSRRLARRMKQWGIDAAICNTFAAASRAATACRMAGIPYAIYAREYIRDIPLYRKILQQANLILAVSADVAAHYRPLVGQVPLQVAYDNILVEPILQRIAASGQDGLYRLPFNPNGPVAGWVGRIAAYKQPELFVRAIPHVIVALPQARFVLIGEAKSGEKHLEDRLRQLASELGVSDQIAFLGKRSDALELMNEMTVLCLTSTREPFARVILEAQVVGCPVIGSRSGGVPEVIQDEANGLLFDANAPDSPEQLAACMIRLMQDHRLATRLALQAKESVNHSFGSERPVREFENMLTNLTQDVNQ